MKDRLYYMAAVPFEAARYLESLPKGHPSRRLHGHSFLARLRAELPVDWAPFPGAEADRLTEELGRCVANLDYGLLNDCISVPTDENIARWIRASVDVPGIEMVGVASTRCQGVTLGAHGDTHIWKRYRFESAHQLPNVPAGHQCGRMHGHGFEVILHATQHVGVDYDCLDTCWAPIGEKLNLACLNEIPGLENPTSESLSAWIWDRIKPSLPQLSWVTVYETVSAGCHFNGKIYRIWKEQRFESALKLRLAPDHDRRRQLHGHSYVLQLHLTAPLDPVMGWTIDYGDVKEVFRRSCQILDHRLLCELDGIEDSDVASLCRWVRRSVEEKLPQLDRIDIMHTPGCGAVLTWAGTTPTPM